MDTLRLCRPKVALILVIFVFSLGCGREKPTIARIKVVNVTGEPVAGAEVTLCACPSPALAVTIPNDILITASDGWAVINYSDEYDQGTGGFRLLDIHANIGDSLFGHGIIKVIDEVVNSQTVVVSVP